MTYGIRGTAVRNAVNVKIKYEVIKAMFIDEHSLWYFI